MDHRTDAANLIFALNGITGFVPPFMFAQLAANPLLKTLEQVANGQIVIALSVPEAPAPAKDAPAAGAGETSTNEAG